MHPPLWSLVPSSAPRKQVAQPFLGQEGRGQGRVGVVASDRSNLQTRGDCPQNSWSSDTRGE